MEINYTKKRIKFEKELNALDILTLNFVSILDKLKIKYVIVSGYVSILFGRSRSSEDVDIVIERIEFEKFSKLWDGLSYYFECLNTDNNKSAYNEYLKTLHAIRFSKKGAYLPNIEIKFPKIGLESFALKERVETIVNKKRLFVSPIELQISFKLFLGSEKDIEDAKHLYKVFKNKLDIALLNQFNRKLKIVDIFNRYLK